MESRRLDHLARTLGSGVSRRGALQGIAAALGLSAISARRAPGIVAAKAKWYGWAYDCETIGDPGFYYYCVRSTTEPPPNPPQNITVRGERCTWADPDWAGPYDSRRSCQE